MPTISRTSVTLRAFGDDLVPEEISDLLACRPDHAVSKGEAWRTRGGAARIARTGVWLRRVADRSPGDLDGQVTELLASATGNLPTWRQVTARFDASVFCGLFLQAWNEGIDLSPTTLGALGARGLRLDLDVYGSSEEDEADPIR